MPTITNVIARYDYKYGATDWKKDVQETFQQISEDGTLYAVSDGQIVQTIETIWEWQSAVAEKSPQLPDPPATFIYADKTYRKDAAYIFQRTHVLTTTYEAYGDTAYKKTVDDFDVLRAQHTITVSIVDGKIPMAPTVGSPYSALINQPITEVLEDNCDFIETRTTIDSQYLQNWAEGATAARRKLQRETAVVRRVQMPANPLMRRGQTVRLVSRKRGVDKRHVLARRTITIDENGGAVMVPELEDWVR